MNNLQEKSYSAGISRADGILLLGAVVGILLLLWQLPSHHPYSLGSASSTDAEMMDLARNLVELEADEDRVWQVAYSPQDNILMGFQHKWGRRAATDTLQNLRLEIPSFVWRVDGQLPGMDGQDQITARLDDTGRLWTLSRPDDAQPLADRDALDALEGEAENTGELALSDTLLAEQFAFDPEGAWGDPVDESAYRREDGQMVLGPFEAAVLATHHLAQAGLADLAFEPDSVWLVGSDDVEIRARTRFSSEREIAGFRRQVEVEVAPGGMFWGMDSHLVDVDDESTVQVGEASFQIGLSAQDPFSITALIAYAVLIIAMVIVFFRRLSARLVDVNMALRDAIFGGILLACMTVLPTLAGFAGVITEIWQLAGIIGIVAVTTGLFGGAVILVLSASSDSGMRRVWPEKLYSLNLVRRFHLFNVPVGAAMLRGVALACTLLAVTMAALLLTPTIPMSLGEAGVFFGGQHVYSPLAFAVTKNGWIALLLLLLLFMGSMAILFPRLPGLAVTIAAIAVMAALLQIAPVTLEAGAWNMLLAAILGGILSACFYRYDAFTCFVGLLLMGVLWDTAPMWMSYGVGTADGIGAWILVLAAVIVGSAGVMSGKKREEIESYVPTYVRDISQRERLQHEIELAQQVQQNLLPRSMPHIEGLDVAALCLPAQEVGGDYYDFIRIDERRVGIVVGDVSGKGIQAAFFMTLAKGFLQTLARQDRSPRDVLTRLNQLFCANVPRGTFISMVYAIVDLKENSCTFVRAGHNPLIHKKAGEKKSRLLQPRGMAIGLTSDSVFESSLEEVTIELRTGDALVLYTDGFTEAVNVNGAQLGSRRFTSYIDSAKDENAQLLLTQVTDQVARFIDGAPRHDDMTVVVIQTSPKKVEASVDASDASTESIVGTATSPK